MIKNLLFFCAAIVLSVNPAFAVEGKTKASGGSGASFFKDPTTGIEFIFVKGGCYQMGDIYDDSNEIGALDEPETPVHEVCVDDYYLGKYEVTQGQWKQIMGSNPSVNGKCGDKCPVENVTWTEVQSFISKLNNKNGGKEFRLPTEAEFEYAQRSGGRNNMRYSGSNDVDSVAWYIANSADESNPYGSSHPVGLKAPNGLGIYDMSGNVWEWVNDWYQADYYSISPRNNPKGPESGTRRVKRGGCWSGQNDNQRVSRRAAMAPDERTDFVGFRLVRIP